MGKAIAYDHRVKIVQRRQKGHPYAAIAEDFNLSVSGVKKVWYRYQKDGEASFATNYKNCGSKSSPYITNRSALEESIKEIRDNQQGASYVHSKLCQIYTVEEVPGIRTLQRWFKAANTNNPKGAKKRNTAEKKME